MPSHCATPKSLEELCSLNEPAIDCKKTTQRRRANGNKNGNNKGDDAQDGRVSVSGRVFCSGGRAQCSGFWWRREFEFSAVVSHAPGVDDPGIHGYTCTDNKRIRIESWL